jgi:hypothetical protein
VTVTHTGDLVSALLGVPGVAAAAVEPTDAGPGTLRLQLLPGADEVGVAGAVNRILRSRFGLAVDADRVRVVGESDAAATADVPADDVPHAAHDLLGPGGAVVPDDADALLEALRRTMPDEGTGGWRSDRPEPAAVAARPPAPPPATAPRPAQAARNAPPARAGRPRLVIERVQLVSAGLTTSVTVVLGVGGTAGRSVQGSADGTATTGSLHRSVAAATLRAVEAAAGDGVRFDVEHVEVARTGSDRTALVVVTMVTERATQRLSGASVVREDVRQAVIRAVLAAVNRRVEPLITAPEGAPA